MRTPAYAGTLANLAARPNHASSVVEDASWDGVKTALAARTPTDIFFACHGKFDPDDPQRSRLFVTKNEPVAFTRMFAELDLRGCRSVFMGACDSGIGRTLVSAEYIGLPLVFLRQAYVIASELCGKSISSLRRSSRLRFMRRCTADAPLRIASAKPHEPRRR